MKKLLYTTSALVGAAFLMEAVVPAKAEVNMSLRYRAALVSQSKKEKDKDTSLEITPKDTEDKSPGQKDRSTALNSAKINIDLSASKDHPNGLTTGANVAIASGKNKLDYDNAFGYIEGSFGKLDVGDFHDVGYRALGYGTPGTSNFGAVDPGFNPAGVAINTSATGNIGARASGIAYWSPSFSGAQVGVSWHPQVTTGGLGGDQTGAEGKKVGLTSKQGDIEDSMAFVATYSGAFGGTGVSMGISYEQAKVVSRKPTNLTASAVVADPSAELLKDGAVSDGKVYLVNRKANTLKTTNTITSSVRTADGDAGFATQTQDPSAFAGYISFDIGQFTVGGSYGVWENANDSEGSIVGEATAYALGASYSVDAITFGVGYSKRDLDATYHHIRVSKGDTFTTGGATLTELDESSPYKETLSSDVLAFTVGYQLGDGAALDFVIEQGSNETLSYDDDDVMGTNEAKTSGFGVGIDLKF